MAFSLDGGPCVARWAWGGGRSPASSPGADASQSFRGAGPALGNHGRGIRPLCRWICGQPRRRHRFGCESPAAHALAVQRPVTLPLPSHPPCCLTSCLATCAVLRQCSFPFHTARASRWWTYTTPRLHHGAWRTCRRVSFDLALSACPHLRVYLSATSVACGIISNFNLSTIDHDRAG